MKTTQPLAAGENDAVQALVVSGTGQVNTKNLPDKPSRRGGSQDS
jgi:hypothetical protein